MKALLIFIFSAVSINVFAKNYPELKAIADRKYLNKPTVYAREQQWGFRPTAITRIEVNDLENRFAGPTLSEGQKYVEIYFYNAEEILNCAALFSETELIYVERCEKSLTSLGHANDAATVRALNEAQLQQSGGD